MNRTKRIGRMLAAALLGLTPLAAAGGGQTRPSDFSFGWKFTKGDPAGAQEVGFDASGWRDVDLPHDWSIAEPKDRRSPGGNRIGFFPTGIGWYRKDFTLPCEEAGKMVFVQFDGVYRDSEVWVNGKSVGRRPNGYATFQYDLTPHVQFGGTNVLAVRVDNSAQPNSRWYSGSGIYRLVHLTVTDRLHIKHWGTTVTTPEVAADRARVRIATEVANEQKEARDTELVTRLVGPDGKVVGTMSAKQRLAPGADFTFVQEFEVPDPERWGIAAPKLYRAESVVRQGDATIDRQVTSFGIRTVRFDKDRGFLLNGGPVKLQGVNLHHDGGSLGAAVPVRALERRLEILKSIGCNAIRTSHNPPAPELPDLCDRMGFVVIDEAFDKWGKPYNRSFPEWGKRDLTDMIRRDRNHPSVVLWSMGNELENQGDPAFLRQLEELVGCARAADPTRPVTVALRPEGTTSEKMTREVVDIAARVDVIGCNYQEQWFDAYRKADPDIIVIGSEIYPFYRGEGDNYKAFKPVNPWLDAATRGFVAGSFYWAGIDYLGEAVAGWPFHGWNGSLIDTCGWVRPVGKLVQSFWTDEPMVHIAVMDKSVDDIKPTKDHWGWPAMRSHWNLPGMEGKTVKVATFTNCPTVELLLNGKAVGRKELKDFPDKMIVWEVPYGAGVLEARGIAGGQVKASHQLRTAGEAAMIRLGADRTAIQAAGRDLCHVEVRITDKDGVLVPSAKHKLRFRVDGPGAIIGVDNGDLTSMESYKGDERSAYHGRALAILQSARTPGRLTLTVEADGLPAAQVRVEAR